MSAILSEIVERRLSEVVHRRLGDEPVVVLQGPRAVGKSTLLRTLAVSRGREIIDLDDLVLEREDGKIAALEVKAASRVPARELRSLLKLRSKLQSQFLGGVVLYTGARAYTHEGIHIMPISRLWRPDSR
jgi:predicted AAA+ superfamily ATPase